MLLIEAIQHNNHEEIEENIKTYPKQLLNFSALFMLGFGRLSDNHIITIFKGLKNNLTIVNLSLSNNDITDIGAIAIAEYLKTNDTLQELNLSCNEITDAGTISIAEGLKTNKKLCYLNLLCNRITDTGKLAMFECLKINTTLRELHIYNSLTTNSIIYTYIRNQLDINICNNKIKSMSLQQKCYQIIKNNNIECPESYAILFR